MVRNLILATLAGIILIAGAFYVIVPPPYPGIFDADLNRLAETYEQGWCAGETFWKTKGGGDPGAAKQCAETLDASTEINHEAVVPAFCRGVSNAGWQGNVKLDCIDFIEDAEMWPTIDGRLSRAFDENYPYPGGFFKATKTDTPDNSRTGDREGNLR